MKPYWKENSSRASDSDANVFIQHSILGRCTFEIRNGQVEITPTRASWQKTATTCVPLGDIVPECEHVRIRAPASIVLRPFFLICFLVVIIRTLLRIEWPDGVEIGIFTVSIGFSIPIIIGLIRVILRLIRPVHIGRFRSAQGKILLNIMREDRQADEFEAFVSRLLSEIKKYKNQNP
jgi:hypothetical protein